MRIYQILMLLDWIKKMKRIKKYKLLMLKLYSVFLLIVVCFCIFLSIYWYIKPRTNDVGENHIYSEEFVNSDTIKLYDNLEFQMKTTLNVSKVANIGVYSSRLDDADKDSKVKMVLQEKGGKILYAMEYNFKDIQGKSVLAIFPNNLNDMLGKEVKLTITTHGVSATNPLILHKTNIENGAKYYLNGEKQQDMYLAYLITGSSPSYFFIWYPMMLLSIVIVLCSVNDWSVLYARK